MKKYVQIFLFSLYLLFIGGCVGGCDNAKPIQPSPQDQIEKYTQTNVIEDADKQLKLIKDAVKTNYYNSYYVYDTKRWGQSDHWDNTYSQMEDAYLKFKSSENITKDAKQDCEDTALTLTLFLVQHGFPYNQLELYFVLVPQDVAGNTNDGGYVGHAIVVAYIDGMQPLVLEQIPYPRTLAEMVNSHGYKFVAVHELDDPIDIWYEADQDVIKYFAEGGIFRLDMLQSYMAPVGKKVTAFSY